MKNKIALSFDVEDWYHLPSITGSTFSKYKTVNDFFENWHGNYDSVTIAFTQLIKLLEKKDISCTFFVVADMITKYPEIFKLLKNSKHEIGCHSLHHQIPQNPKTKQVLQSPSEWKQDLISSKNLIESYFEKKIIGYRAPGAVFMDWMVDILLEAGFEYDSSVAFNSIYNKTNVKLTETPTTPYFINSKTLNANFPVTQLVELPWSYYKLLGINFPVGGAFFYRLLGNNYFIQGLNQCLKKGDTMFYMHPIDFSNEPMPMHNHLKRPLYWINKGSKSLIRMEKLIKNYKGSWTTCQEVYLNFKKKQMQMNNLG